MDKEIMSLIEILKVENEFNLESIIKEEINEFDEELKIYNKKYKHIYNNLCPKELNTKIMIKDVEEVLQEVADVIVVINQLEGEFNINFRKQLNENFEKDRSKELEGIFNKLVLNYYEFIIALVKYKCERTIFRNKFGYYKIK